MKATLHAVLCIFLTAGCGGGGPTTPPPPPGGGGGGGTLILSGIVYGVDATGRRPLVGATVDISEPGAAWGTFGRPVTNANGRYTFGSLSPRHYLGRATMPGYDESPTVTIGYLETSKTVDFELVQTGLFSGPATVTSIDPAVGSTGGGTPVTIRGTNLRTGSTLTFDTESTTAFLANPTTIYAISPAHGEGSVSVSVTSPGGETVTLAGGFRFAAPGSFDFNGTWKGYALAHPVNPQVVVRSQTHDDMALELVIENNTLTRFTCGGATVALPTPPPAVSNGAFELPEGAAILAGRIVSATIAIGTINTPACPGTRWEAIKQ